MSTREAKSNTRPHHPTFVGTVIFGVVKLLLFAGLAWVILSVWFVIVMLREGQATALFRAQHLVDATAPFIHESRSLFAPLSDKAFVRAGQWLQWQISSFTFWNLAWLRNVATCCMTVFEIVLGRCFILLLSIPLFLIVLGVAFVDGLVKRDIRKFQGARESAFTFHRIKKIFPWVFFVPILFFLCLPVAVSPVAWLLTQAIALGVVVMAMTLNFKKYL